MKKVPLKPLIWTSTIALILVVPLALSSAEKKRVEKSHSQGQASAKEGEALFKQTCNMCHFPDKTDKKIGPGLKDLFKNKELPASHKPVTEANVRAQIEKGSPQAKPMPMPAFKEKLTPEQIESLLSYLKTL